MRNFETPQKQKTIAAVKRMVFYNALATFIKRPQADAQIGADPFNIKQIKTLMQA